MLKKQRLDKFIANQLIISRSIVRTSIQRGKVSVNDVVVRDAGALIDVSVDKIAYEGNIVGYKEYVYILMNKPKGILSASTDKSRQTVIDLVPKHLKRQGIAPVGRLDKDTTGLLLITDDGVFGHNVISPKKDISKTYIVKLDGDISDDMILAFKNGVILADGTACRPAILERIDVNIARISITEGKYHQVKRLLGHVGLGVVKLHRERIGQLILPGNLICGEIIELEYNDAMSVFS